MHALAQSNAPWAAAGADTGQSPAPSQPENINRIRMNDCRTLLQAFRTKVFLTTSDPETARYASELCGKADKTRISYTVSESSSNANVGWLSGRTSSNKGSVSASKQYQKQKEPLFDGRVFFELKNAQSVIVAYDGISPLPATYCYLKPDFLPVWMTWFEQEQIDFDPRGVQR